MKKICEIGKGCPSYLPEYGDGFDDEGIPQLFKTGQCAHGIWVTTYNGQKQRLCNLDKEDAS